MHRRHTVRLTDAGRGHLEALVRCGRAHARSLLYARILLKTDANENEWTDERIADALGAGCRHRVARERRRFSKEKLEVALMPRKPGRPRRRRRRSVLDGRRRTWWRSPARSRPRGEQAGR